MNERRQYYGHVGVIERGADFRGGVFIQFLQRNKPSHLIGVQSYIKERVAVCRVYVSNSWIICKCEFEVLSACVSIIERIHK